MVLGLVTTMISSFAYLIRQACFSLRVDWLSGRNYPASRWSALTSHLSVVKCMLSMALKYCVINNMEALSNLSSVQNSF